MVRAESICKVFTNRKNKQIVAIDEFNLQVREKEFVTILGPSGCGKSTFLLLAAGLNKATGGRIMIDGQTVNGPDPKRAIVFQEYLLFPWKTVRDNVEFGPQVRGLGKDERRRISSKYIDLVGLKNFENRYPHELSGGMKQRVAIARALANEPKVMLMDEPFGALDALTRELLQHELLRIWQETQCTVLFVTHSINEAVYLSDRVVVMSKRPGRIMATLTIDIPRPRTRAVLTTPEFVSYEQTLRKLIWEEIQEPPNNEV
jgi:NitT/TauT family transport system ATP-binding protein